MEWGNWKARPIALPLAGISATGLCLLLAEYGMLPAAWVTGCVGINLGLMAVWFVRRHWEARRDIILPTPGVEEPSQPVRQEVAVEVGTNSDSSIINGIVNTYNFNFPHGLEGKPRRQRTRWDLAGTWGNLSAFLFYVAWLILRSGEQARQGTAFFILAIGCGLGSALFLGVSFLVKKAR